MVVLTHTLFFKNVFPHACDIVIKYDKTITFILVTKFFLKITLNSNVCCSYTGPVGTHLSVSTVRLHVCALLTTPEAEIQGGYHPHSSVVRKF